MASPGRPSLFTEELATRICERLAAGETLRGVCSDDEMPSPQTVLAWTRKNEEFSEQYARARQDGYELLADQLVAISDDKTGDPARDRLRVDTRKWLLSKALPKIYGDRQQIEHSGSIDLALVLDKQIAEMRERANALR